MAKITGNKGEWSELYVLLYLLANGKLYAADENLNRLENIFFPVLKIYREYKDLNKKVEYEISHNTPMVAEESPNAGEVLVYLNDDFVCALPQKEILKAKQELYVDIKNGPGAAFPIERVEHIMEKLCCYKIKAPSSNKSDIEMQIHDVHTGYSPVCGFSIKSDLGNSPTLLNASEATNFVFKVKGLTRQQAEQINGINTKHKIVDKMAAIDSYGAKLEFAGMYNDIFQSNLLMIDSFMQNILSYIMEYSYQTGKMNCLEILLAIEEKNPLKYPRTGMYMYKFKKFLCAIALGLMPSKKWDGYEEANGGYIIVKSSGDVVAYHIYNRNSFEDYLLANTKFERGSTSRHKYATIYEKGGELFINLNMQIRFI